MTAWRCSEALQPSKAKPAIGCCRCSIRPPTDAVDWQRGNYSLTTRGGRVESECRLGQIEEAHAHGGRRLGAGVVGSSRAAPPPMSRPMVSRIPSIAPDSRTRSHAGAVSRGCRMKYRVTCLTPTLVGDGQKLAPIDYMVWKDHVNVLDQRRIFRLLAKGPRLEGYLAQLKKADKLDFASWGGFAQNFAGRRIPFEHASSIPFWERARCGKSVHPDFCDQRQRPLPARDGDQRSAAHRRGVRPLDRKHPARLGRAHRRPRRRAIPRPAPKTPCWADRETTVCGASRLPIPA